MFKVDTFMRDCVSLKDWPYHSTTNITIVQLYHRITALALQTEVLGLILSLVKSGAISPMARYHSIAAAQSALQFKCLD